MIKIKHLYFWAAILSILFFKPTAPVKKFHVDESDRLSQKELRELYSLSQKCFGPTLFPSIKIFELCICQRKHLIARDEKGNIIGWLAYSFQNAKDVYIPYLCRAPHCPKMGVGTTLLKNLLEKPIDNISLEVRFSNEKAIRFYEKFGFEQTTFIPNYYCHPKEDGIIMQYHRSPAAIAQ